MWRKNFTKIVDGFFRRAQPLSSCDWTSLYPASLTRFSVGFYTESPINIEDGTWTLNLPQGSRHRDGLWTGWLEREAIVHPRFQRARFVLAEGPAVLISAADLRRALAAWLADPNGGNSRFFKIDFEYNTVNGVPVEMSSGT